MPETSRTRDERATGAHLHHVQWTTTTQQDVQQALGQGRPSLGGREEREGKEQQSHSKGDRRDPAVSQGPFPHQLSWVYGNKASIPLQAPPLSTVGVGRRGTGRRKATHQGTGDLTGGHTAGRSTRPSGTGRPPPGPLLCLSPSFSLPCQKSQSASAPLPWVGGTGRLGGGGGWENMQSEGVPGAPAPAASSGC